MGWGAGGHVCEDVHEGYAERVIPLVDVGVPYRVVRQRPRQPGVGDVVGRRLDHGPDREPVRVELRCHGLPELVEEVRADADVAVGLPVVVDAGEVVGEGPLRDLLGQALPLLPGGQRKAIASEGGHDGQASVAERLHDGAHPRRLL